MNTNDIGQYFIRRDKDDAIPDVWMMVSSCELPTVTLENVRTGEKIEGAIGCLLLQPFVKLVPEDRSVDGKK